MYLFAINPNRIIFRNVDDLKIAVHSARDFWKPIMSMIDDLLMRYSAGDLDPGLCLIMSSYVHLEPEAREKLDEYESINAALLDNEPPAELSNDSLDTLLELLDKPAESELPQNGHKYNYDLPLPLRSVLDDKIENKKWRFTYPGVKSLFLNNLCDNTEVRLLKIKPGKSAPRHSHNGIEATLVLRGAFKDGDEIYQRGDLAIADEGVEHRPRAVGEEECLCLAVTHGSLKFKDRLGRVVKDFIS